MQEASLAHRQRLERFALVNEVYEGFYAHFTPQDEEGMRYLGGSWAPVGMEFELAEHEGGLAVVTQDGHCVAPLERALAARIRAFWERDWVVHCILAFITYNAEEKAFTGEFACICYSPQLSEGERGALETFIGNITKRIAQASHPSLSLTQEQFVRVIESKGAWFLTKNLPWPELPRGTVFYRRRRTLSDRLVSAAVKGNKGCLFLSWTVIALVVLGLIWAVWFFLF
jgi:hypothetical protein